MAYSDSGVPNIPVDLFNSGQISGGDSYTGIPGYGGSNDGWGDTSYFDNALASGGAGSTGGDYGFNDIGYGGDYGNGSFVNTSAYSNGDFSNQPNYFDPTSDKSGDDEWRRSLRNSLQNNSNPYQTMGKDIQMPDNGMFGSTIQGIAKNPLVRMLMSLNPATAVLNAAARGNSSLGGTLGSMAGSALGPLGSLFGGAAGSGLGSLLGGQNTTVGSFLPSASSIGGLGGSLFGGLAGGATGSMLGGMGGSYLGNLFSQNAGSGTPGINSNSSYTGSYSPDASNSGGMGGINDSALGLLPSLYAGNRQNNEIKGQINNLNQLFSPNSAYAQDMRKQLERRDAAAGRRSQYGGREVELQAKLATLAAQQAPQIDKLTQQRQQNRNLLIQTALRNPGVQDLIKKGGMSLMDLFNTPSVGVPNDSYSNFDSSTLPNLIGETGGWLGGLGGGDQPSWGF